MGLWRKLEFLSSRFHICARIVQWNRARWWSNSKKCSWLANRMPFLISTSWIELCSRQGEAQKPCGCLNAVESQSFTWRFFYLDFLCCCFCAEKVILHSLSMLQFCSALITSLRAGWSLQQSALHLRTQGSSRALDRWWMSYESCKYCSVRLREWQIAASVYWTLGEESICFNHEHDWSTEKCALPEGIQS